MRKDTDQYPRGPVPIVGWVRDRARRAGHALIAPVLFLCLAGFGASGAEGPPILYANVPHYEPTFPVWVSVDAALDSSGDLNESLFRSDALASLRKALDILPSRDGCTEFGPFYEDWVNPPDLSTIDKAARASTRVFVGTIVGRSYGFRRGLPGQLLTFELTRALKGEAALDTYYFFHPVARFEAGPYTICRTDSRYADPPDIGDEVVLLLPYRADPSEPYLELAEATSLIVIHQNGSVSLPQIFAKATAGNAAQESSLERDATIQRVEAAVRDGGER